MQYLLLVSQPMYVCNAVIFSFFSAEKRRVYDQFGKEGLKSGGVGGGGKPGTIVLV